MSPRCLFGDLNSFLLFWPQWQRLCELEGTSGGQTRLLMILSTMVLKTPQTLETFSRQLLPMLKLCHDVKVLPYTQSLCFNSYLLTFIHVPCLHPCLPPSSEWPHLTHWSMLMHLKTISSPVQITPSPLASPHRTSVPSTSHFSGTSVNLLWNVFGAAHLADRYEMGHVTNLHPIIAAARG